MSTELIRGELERLYSLEEMMALSSDLLGFEPTSVGGTASSASFARALTNYCDEHNAVAALIDAVNCTREDASPRLDTLADEVLRAPVELSAGAKLGDFKILRKLGAGPNGTVYAAQHSPKDGESCKVVLKLLHTSATHDRSALHRFLTRTRLLASLAHDFLPASLRAGFVEQLPFVCYDLVEGKPLAPRIARTGALHINEARPLIHGIVEAMRAVHQAGFVHGAIKLENILVGKRDDGTPHVMLVDPGGDLLWSSWVHSDISTAGNDRIKGMAPELLKGLRPSAQSDFYALGAVLFEVLTGKPAFEAKNASELAVAHLSKAPALAVDVAPRGWVDSAVSDLCSELLHKEPENRPSGVDAILKVIGPIEKSKEQISDSDLDNFIDSLIADPTDIEAAIALELTIEQRADPNRVAEAFLVATDQIDAEAMAKEASEGETSGAVADMKSEAARDRARDLQKGLLFRAARIFENEIKDSKRAETVYQQLMTLDPLDSVAFTGFERALKGQDRLVDLVEALLERSEASESHRERAHCMNKIGHLYVGALEDQEQAVFAFAQALAQDVQNDTYADDLERAAGNDMTSWAEAMRSLHEVSEHPTMPEEVRVSLFMRLGRWYEIKIQRPDLALPCYESVLSAEPAHVDALDGVTNVYRRAQQWPELVGVLLSRAERTLTPERSRDLRAEAADLLANRLAEGDQARDLYEAIREEDPAHEGAVAALGDIYQRDENYSAYAKLLEAQANALSGDAQADALCRIAELYEDRLDDLSLAQTHYEAALESAPGSMNALRGLDRVFNRTSRYVELLDNLQKQVTMAATPRQRINLHERIAGIHDEEFLDHANAALAFEAVLDIDSAHEGALTSLMRHYRALDRWDDVIELYDRNLRVCTDDALRASLLMAQGRALLDQVGSPERARIAYENVLQLDPDHGGALEALAHLRAATGDAMAALTAVEALAEKAESAQATSDLWVRAAKILEGHGDRDGAIQRYKAALDAQSDNVVASSALRAAYLARGDAASAAELLSKDIERTEGKLARARLYGELARIKRNRMSDIDGARAAATKALDLDPTNLEALMLMGDVAFETENMLEAATHYGSLANRLDALDAEDAKRVLIRFIDSLAASGSTEEAKSTIDKLLEVAPDDPQALRRAARVRLDAGDGPGAAELYQRLNDHFAGEFDDNDKAETLLHFGKALRLAGEFERALRPLSDAADLDPEALAPLEELAAVYADQERWEEVIRIKKRRLDIAEGHERAMLLVEIGEIFAEKLDESTKASKNFAAALEEQPDDRRVLTRLMRLYSEEKDWGKLVDVVLKLAEGVEDTAQKAKYIHTAAIVCARQLEDYDQALRHLDQVLELDPNNANALGEAIEVRESMEDYEGMLELLDRAFERSSEDPAEQLKLLERKANLYADKLDRVDEAITTLETLQQLDPDNVERTARLLGMYTANLEEHLDKAIALHMASIHRDPFDATPYRTLRRIFTESKDADAAWCLCQALYCMSSAEPDEERFFRRMRAETAANAQERLSDEDWIHTLMHPWLDPLVTAVFQLVQPAIISRNSQPLEQLGYQGTFALDLSTHPYPMSQTLYYAGGVLDMDLPPCFQNPNDGGGISFLHTHQPSIVLGAAALAAELPPQAGAFIAARHLTYYRAGLYIRHLVPTGTGLRTWLFAAIRLIHDTFPVSEELESTVAENLEAIRGHVHGPARDQLASAVTKLLQSGAIDLKRWVAAVDLTADRVGFLVCHDLEIANEMIRASDEASAALDHRDRIRELSLFSVGPEYFALRKRLGIGIDA